MVASPFLLAVATEKQVVLVDPRDGAVRTARGIPDSGPTCLAGGAGRGLWCGSRRDGLLGSEDGGLSWERAGLPGRHVTAVAVSPADPDLVWAGTEPSQLWCSEDGGGSWERMHAMEALPSSPEWSFPPRPDTHHVRWIACHPESEGRLWVAIEAGALVATTDRGRNWRDRVAGGPYDTHELAIHPDRPETLRVAAGDGYHESRDGGTTWSAPGTGLDVGYLRSVAIDPGDPDVVIVSASTGPRSAYVAGRSDGRLYRRDDRGDPAGEWTRIRDGWPDPARTIAPLLLAGRRPGELWAADERGVHLSADGGRAWVRVAAYPKPPDHLRGLIRVDFPQ